MSQIKELIELIKKNSECIVHSPSTDKINLEVPDDLMEFYEYTNGVSLFPDKPYGIEIVEKSKLISTNEFLYPKNDVIWEELENDVTNDWFLIAKSDELSQYISVDLTKDKFGKCYDSFYDTHGEEGMSQIIAKNFTDLLTNLYKIKGLNWFWLESDFENLGDAFD